MLRVKASHDVLMPRHAMLARVQARTVVFITHDLDEAMRVGDRIAIMQAGEVVQVGTPEEIVRHPANDYVRSFFRDVNVSHVFTAGDIARRDQVTIVDRPGMSLRAALSRLDQHDRENAVVHDRHKRYLGTVSADSLKRCIREIGPEAEGRIEMAYMDQVPALAADTPLDDLLAPVASAPFPVVIVDSEGDYHGTVSRSVLLHALNRSEEQPGESAAQTEAEHA